MVEKEAKVYDELLSEVNKIIQKKENKYKNLALDFNFFTIAGINRKEVINCRFLCELLNPKGLHSEGSLFLKKFIQNIIYDDEVLQEEINDIENNSTIEKEEVIDDGRVDIVIHIKDKVIPIEVKIDANDQSRQIKRYFENYKEILFDDKVYYLTINGDEPSDDSKGELKIGKDGNIKCISWKNITHWIDDCIKEMALNIIKSKKQHVIEIMRQFKQNIEYFCGIGDNEMEEEIKKLLMEKKGYYLSALKLLNEVNLVSCDIMLNFFDKLQKIMTKNLEEKFNIKTDCIFGGKERIESYYLNGKTTSYPYLWFRVNFNKNFKNDIGICFELESDGRFCFGVKPKDENKNADDETFLKYIVPEGKFRKSASWYWWNYIDEVGEFNNGSDDLANLLDENEMNKKIEKFIRIANEYIENKKEIINSN